jgi:hypothetical protein
MDSAVGTIPKSYRIEVNIGLDVRHENNMFAFSFCSWGASYL